MGVKEVQQGPLTRNFKYFLGTRHTFPLWDGGKSPPHIEADPIGDERLYLIQYLSSRACLDPQSASHTMSQNPTDGPYPETRPPDPCESPMVSPQRTPTPKPSRGPGEEMDGRIEDTARSVRPVESMESQMEAIESEGQIATASPRREEESENVMVGRKRMEVRLQN